MGGNGISRYERFYMLRYFIAMQQGKSKMLWMKLASSRRVVLASLLVRENCF